MLDAQGLNRVVVAACSPRTHEPLFQDTLRQAGLNKYLVTMANIRNQDSWVHQGEPGKATDKAKDLVRMAVARVRRQAPQTEIPFLVEHQALVVGGGLAGMTAALTIADAGFQTYLVEKDGYLGGVARHVHYTLQGREMQPFLTDLIHRVESHPGIVAYKNTRVVDFSGHVGKFRSTLKGPDGTTDINYAAAVIATGGQEYQPTEHLFGQHPRVLTQLQLEQQLAQEPDSLVRDPWVAMIQCVGCRNAAHPYCSRICCSVAVKNALKIKELQPQAKVFVLYRDIRTFGFQEIYYRQARERGVHFIRFEADREPQVTPEGNRLRIQVHDAGLNAALTLPADYLVLSAAIRPHPDSAEIARLFKLPLDGDGFFMEAHMKLRPLDFATEGFYLCGLAHGPKASDETITQARGAAARALTVLSRQEMLIGGSVAQVTKDRCAACLTCVRTCPYQVPVIDASAHVASIDPAKCQGCGICVAECPFQAIRFTHNRDEQMEAEIKAI